MKESSLRISLIRLFILFFCLPCSQVLAEDDPALTSPSPESSPVLDNSPAPTVPASVNQIEGGEALDSWIKRDTSVEKIEKESTKKENTGVDAVDGKSLLEEEKKLYQQLIGSYKNTNRREDSIQRIFQKDILTKVDQARIDRAKKVQASIRRIMKAKYKAMTLGEIDQIYPTRICNLSFSIMGLTSEVKKFKATMGVPSAKVLKAAHKEVVDKGCEVIFVSGLVSKTHTNSLVFLDQFKNTLVKLSNEEWGYRESSATGGGFFAVVYRSKKYSLKSSNFVDKVSLRRGGDFVEDKFSMPPLEVLFSRENSKDKDFRIFAFDFIFETSPLKDLKASYQMQMASALKELMENRAKENSEVANILMVNMRVRPGNPVTHVLENHLGLENFLPEAGCVLIESKEPGQEAKFECDASKLLPRKRALFSSYGDLYQLPVRASAREWKRLSSLKRSAKSGIYVLQSDLSAVYQKDGDFGPRAGLSRLGQAGLEAELVWSDFNFRKE